MKYWFTADYHLGHENIIKYCGRPFKSLEHMNYEIIRRHNERIKPEDVVFFLGDFCFKSKSGRGEGIGVNAYEWTKKLNGQIIFIKGNHDRNNSCKTIIDRVVINYGGKRINLVHNPEHIDASYDINFIGHVHEKWNIQRIKRGWQFTDCVNVGVDVWDFYPISFEEIMKRYQDWLKQNGLILRRIK